MVDKLEDRPPYVTFETESVEDREASITAGHYVGRDVDMVYITPAGSKDRIVRVVSEWFQKLADDLAAERVPREWVNAFKAAYEDYKAGRGPVANGIPILDWPGLSPSQVKTLQSLRLLAVEDVAAMNEEAIARIGMGGRALKQRAIDYLAASKDVGKVAEKASRMEAELQIERQRNERIEEKMAAMAMELQALKSQAPQGPALTSLGITSADLLDDSPSLGAKL